MEINDNSIIERLESKIENQRNELIGVKMKLQRLEASHEENRNRIDDIKNIQIVELENITKLIGEGLKSIQNDFKIIKYSSITFFVGLIASQMGLIEFIKTFIIK